MEQRSFNPAGPSVLGQITGKTGLLVLITRLIVLRRERQALARLDDHLLADIGLDQQSSLQEARRPPWDVPDSWRR
jgi:uncharacterized protein YjiS (DUF1127 family)